MVLWLTYPFLTPQIKKRRGTKIPYEICLYKTVFSYVQEYIALCGAQHERKALIPYTQTVVFEITLSTLSIQTPKLLTIQVLTLI